MRSIHALAIVAILACLATGAGAAPRPAGGAINYHAPAADPAAEQVRALLPGAKAQVEAFFGQPFAEPLNVTLAPDRASFNAAFPKAWGMDKTECWMVGVGVADFLVVLSPADGKKEACDHNSADATELRDLVAHELVHMYHGQRNPSRDFTGEDDIG